MQLRAGDMARQAAWLLAAVLVCGLTLVGMARAERLALVVGNGNYEVAPDLKNSVGDAVAMSSMLTDLGFTVTLLKDESGPTLWSELDKFIFKAESAESVVFYYSGHAFQMSGVNYLVPVSAKLTSREAAVAETWSLDAIIGRLQSRSRQTLIFLDACRNDPLPSAVRGSGAASDGLARVQTGVGTFVAFATGPGGVSVDGVGEAEHSPFTTALLKHVPTVGISISDMMIEVRNDVEVATLRKQEPWDQSSLREQFYFVPPQQAAKQELSEADYELLAQLSVEDRKTFLDLLAQSGFDEDSLKKAEAEIAVAEANLEMVATQTVVVGAVVEDVVATLPEVEPEQEINLADLVMAPATVTVGVATASPSVEVAQEKPDAPIRLAALNWDTRDIALNEVTIQRLRLEGKVLRSDNESDRSILAAIDPSLLEDDMVPTVAAGDLARSVQAELKRVGCYQMGVDGSWGKGSRTALTSYYLTKRIVPVSLEPNEDLFLTLRAEKNVVCKVRVASSAVKTGVRAKVKAPEAAVVKTKANRVTTGKNGTRPPETAKKKIEKSAIGMTGSF